MNSSFNNVALFIKRAEEYQTKEFIIQAFNINYIGIVKDVKFIKKNNDFGKIYNGVIVIFERWFSNKKVETLFKEMSSSKDGSTKLFIDQYKYWIINVHKQKLPECEETSIVDQSLPDKERIAQLEALVKSMNSQIFYLQNKQEKSERELMDKEQKETYHHLLNMELKSQLEEKNWEKRWAEDKLNQEIIQLKEENDYLRCKLALTAIDMTMIETQNEKLQEEVREGECILEYIQNQAKDMKMLLRGVLETDPIKPVINNYMKENLD